MGHSEREIERLKAQALLVDPITRRFFLEAGLARGMRLLDVGRGAGDVAFAAAQIVGSNGEMVGVDRAPAALAIARSRAAAQSLSNVSFEEGDPAEMVFDRAFDAVIGRYVLQFQAEPAAMLGKLAAHLRPGGVLVFHEIDWGRLSSFPPVPTFGEAMKSVAQLLKAKGNIVISIAPTASVLECLKLFADKGIGAALVMQGEKMVGIFSERDYDCKVALHGKSSKDLKVQEVMTTDVLWVGPERTNVECMALMTEKRIRHLPVMEGGKVIGIISIGDLVKDIIAEQEFVIAHLEHYIMGER